MIPEIEINCAGKTVFVNSITVEQYKKYVGIMEKNDSPKKTGAMFLNKKIIQDFFGNRISLAELGKVEVVEFLAAVKAVHFIMQSIITERLLSIVEIDPIERETSAFDEYDAENGYEEETEPEENVWKVCGEIADRVIKIAIRLLKNSYSQCMSADIMPLLDYLKFELDTVNENQ